MSTYTGVRIGATTKYGDHGSPSPKKPCVRCGLPASKPRKDRPGSGGLCRWCVLVDPTFGQFPIRRSAS